MPIEKDQVRSDGALRIVCYEINGAPVLQRRDDGADPAAGQQQP